MTAGLLEMSVDIAGIGKSAKAQALGNLEKNTERRPLLDLAVHGKTIPVKSPSQPRMLGKGRRIGNVLKTHFGFAKCWINAPETFRTTNEAFNISDPTSQSSL